MGVRQMRTIIEYDALPELRPIHSSPRPSINPDAGIFIRGSMGRRGSSLKAGRGAPVLPKSLPARNIFETEKGERL